MPMTWRHTREARPSICSGSRPAPLASLVAFQQPPCRLEAGGVRFVCTPRGGPLLPVELSGSAPTKRTRDLVADVTILLVEDNPDDAALTELALRGDIPARLQVARDGEEALDYLFNHANDLPRLVLLDLRLPNIDGLEVLRRIRENERTCLTPVVILTSSTAPDDVATGYRYGANSYVGKPLDFDQFSGLLRELGSYWLRVNAPPPNTSDH